METTITGRTRHRLQKRFMDTTLLVLQIEKRTLGVDYSQDVAGGIGKDIDSISWYDATIEDLQELKGIEID
mgnify:CR=1 FL=1